MHTILSYFAYKILVYNIVSMTSSPIYQKEKKEKKKTSSLILLFTSIITLAIDRV